MSELLLGVVIGAAGAWTVSAVLFLVVTLPDLIHRRSAR